MRIAWFANIDFQEGNAANSRIRGLAKGLKKNGHYVFLFFLSPTIFNSNGINKKSKGFFDGIYFNYLNGSSHRSSYRTIRFLSYLRAIFNSSALLIKKRKRFDVIFLYNPRLLFFGHIYLLAKFLNIPLIIEKTELEQKHVYKNIFHRLLGFTDRLDPYLLKYFCAHLIVISDKLKTFYSNYFPQSRISKIPIIVDLNRFSNPLNGEKKYNVGYLGSFAEKDGVEGLIKGFKEAHNALPNLKLNLIGFNPNKKKINLELKRLNMNGSVVKSGQITYNQVPQWLYKCDLLIMNRTNEDYSHYGFPTKLGEYLATGIPTICSNVGDVSTYLTHQKNTIFIEPDNDKQLSEAIINRYQNYDAHSEIGLKGKEIAKKHFNYLLYVPVLENVFEEVISQYTNKKNINIKASPIHQTNSIKLD